MVPKGNQVPLPAVAWEGKRGELRLLDQTCLPGEERILAVTQPEEVFAAIARLQVRGAPAIGVAAAFGLYLAARRWGEAHPDASRREWEARLQESARYLAAARPTAVNLTWSLNRLMQAIRGCTLQKPADLAAVLLAEAETILAEDVQVCRAIGEHGLELLRPGTGLLTHCNAGRLATIRYGTALAPIYLGEERGYGFHVYCDETRPLLQGARLTAYELTAAGVDATLICDNMAATVMAQGRVEAVLVGCDRVAANGDFANKIGTLGVAVLARYFHIPFYVCAPTSTIDLACPVGQAIPIEERDGEEIRSLWYAQPQAPAAVDIYNPAFDVTPAELVTAFITEKGILSPPYETNLAVALAPVAR